MSPKQPSPTWTGTGSTTIPPTGDYWGYLAPNMPGRQLDALQALMDQRIGEISPSDLPPPADAATALLDLVAADGWLERRLRHTCPDCAAELVDRQREEPACPFCGIAFDERGGVSAQTVYVRSLAPSRDVDWVVALHGMNTRGAWQEELSWLLATTWGRSVPVAVYKYGKVITGVIRQGRRRALLRKLRLKLAALRDQAKARGFTGNPDVLAHSFGTWLLGHLLLAELDRPQTERLAFGRVILAGCVLRPDFPWAEVKAAGLVEEVLNHYGTRDPVVPLAHATIRDSGPSGRRGFDGAGTHNIRAEGYGHSDLLTTERWVVDDQPFRRHASAASETHLAHAYRRCWKPFLTLPATELHRLPDRADPATPWRQLPWPLRGTLFPLFALPLAASLVVLALAGTGWVLLAGRPMPPPPSPVSAAGLGAALAAVSAGGLALVITGICGTSLVRWVWKTCIADRLKRGEAA